MERFRAAGVLLLVCSLSGYAGRLSAAAQQTPSVDLREMLVPSPLRDVAAGSVVVCGRAALADGQPLRVRVTTSSGRSFEATAKVGGKRFSCRYPQDWNAYPESTAFVQIGLLHCLNQPGGAN